MFSNGPQGLRSASDSATNAMSNFENEFPAIVYNDAQTSKSDLLTEPILSPKHIDEFDLNDETSVSEYDEEEQYMLYFNDLFPFNIIYLDDLKSEKDNDNNEIDIIQSSEASDEELEELMEDQPLPVDASYIALSPSYIADFDSEEDEEDPEEDPADYPADGGDNYDNESSDDDDDDDDVENDEKDKEEEHLALADPSAVPTDDHVPSS
ncbi:hypothetical protein Tco_0242302 [Tanacetum coccineum]